MWSTDSTGSSPAVAAAASTGYSGGSVSPRNDSRSAIAAPARQSRRASRCDMRPQAISTEAGLPSPVRLASPSDPSDGRDRWAISAARSINRASMRRRISHCSRTSASTSASLRSDGRTASDWNAGRTTSDGNAGGIASDGNAGGVTGGGNAGGTASDGNAGRASSDGNDGGVPGNRNAGCTGS